MSSTASSPANRSGTQSIERAIAVLECLSASEISLSLTEISRHVGLSASTTHRLLRALTQAGYVDQDHSTERYGLGIGVAVLGQRAIERSGYQLARPVLAGLSERTGESASLGVRRGAEVVVLDRIAGPAPLRFDHPAGAELAVHASAMGKVLLAFSSASIADEVRALDVLQPFTTRTIVDREALATELADVFARGYATNSEERYDGVSGIAAPVRSPTGHAHAAVGLQGPSLRLNPVALAGLAPLVQAAADEVAAVLIPH
ncbi:MAG TPA: IclR family transcriptional regulator [Ilumatobacteraceae bacterium]|nr:IclR family transcriptional regulator [Ilumatobacteraceae bacterium]